MAKLFTTLPHTQETKLLKRLVQTANKTLLITTSKTKKTCSLSNIITPAFMNVFNGKNLGPIYQGKINQVNDISFQ